MKILILGAVLALTGSTASAQYPPPPQYPQPVPPYQSACACGELERRIDGLQYVDSYGPVSPYERQELEFELQHGGRALERSRNVPYYEQDGLCGQGNQMVDREWVRWQPWIASNDADRGNYLY